MKSHSLPNSIAFKLADHIGEEMSGKQFNNLFVVPNINTEFDFVKLTNKYEDHNNFQFQDGFNKDIHEFNHDTPCSKGGFYFTTKSFAYMWICYNNYDLMHYMRIVTIPNNAKVYIESGNKFKTDKFILGGKKSISMDIYVNGIMFNRYSYNSKVMEYIFDCLKNITLYTELVKYDGCMLQYIPYDMRDEEICTEALRQNKLSIKYVPIHILIKLDMIGSNSKTIR